MNRHLYGATLPVQGNIADCIAVEPGDLMFVASEGIHLCLNKDLRGKSGGTNYCYPIAAGVTESVHFSGATCSRFIGVSLDDSPNGSTDTISIATGGIFEFPLTAQAGVTLGQIVSANPTGYSAGSRTTASYQVAQSVTGVTIGWCVKTEAGAKTIRVVIRSMIGPGGIGNY